MRPAGLSVGHHTLQIAYTGTACYLDSEKTVEFEITPTPVTVTLSPERSQIRQGEGTRLHVDLSIQAIGATGTPPGTVGIYCDDALLVEAPLDSGCTPIEVKLPVGDHQLKAVYLGSGDFASGESDLAPLKVLPNPQAMAMLTLKGQTLSGWAFDPDSPRSQLRCTILLDGKDIRTIKANRNTPRSLGIGRHGLQYVLPKLTPGNHQLEIITRDPVTSQATALGGFGIVVRSVRGRKTGTITRVIAMPLGSSYSNPWTGPDRAYAGQKSPGGYDYYLPSGGTSVIS